MAEKGMERLEETEDKEDKSETESSGHDRTPALMNSHSCGYLDRISPVNILAWNEKGFMRSPYP